VPEGVRTVMLRAGFPGRGRVLALRADRAGWHDLARPVLLPLAGATPIRFLPGLVAYLRRERPAALLSAKTHTNLTAIWAREIAGVATQIVVSERSHLSAETAGAKGRKWRWRYVAPIIRRAYPRADAIVSVSDGVADDIAAATGLPRTAIETVYNPVVSPRL